MTSPYDEMAEQWEYDDMFERRRIETEKAVLCNAIEFYSGMSTGRALELYLDKDSEYKWDILLEEGD